MTTISVSGWLFEHPGEAAFAIGIGWFSAKLIYMTVASWLGVRPRA